MDDASLLESLGIVGLSMAVPLFAVSVRRCRGSVFGSVVGLLGVVVALAVGTALVDTVPMLDAHRPLAKVTLVGAAAVVSAASAVRLVGMTTGRWSV
ncbi:MAG: hypothetical protein ABEH83_09105 [Halobacterium sp.]